MLEAYWSDVMVNQIACCSLAGCQTNQMHGMCVQKPQVLGHKVEAKIAELVRQNTTLVKFGIFLETAGARVLVQEHLKKNNDQGKDQVEVTECQTNRFM